MLRSALPAWANAGAPNAGDYPRMPLLVQLGLSSLFAFPVVIGDEVVAVLEFFSRELQTPDDSMLRLMAQIGTQLGRVIERRRAQERLLHDALHDPLTQLGNRKLFLDRLEHFLVRSQRMPDYQFAVLFVDLDRFKAINDGLGHQAGDQVIVGTAQRLSACLRQTDLVTRDAASDHIVSRLGGDEFTVLLDNVERRRHARSGSPNACSRRSPRRCWSASSRSTSPPASASRSVRAATRTCQDMLRDADIAMYHAKQHGRARWMMFDQTMQEGALRRLTLEAELRLPPSSAASSTCSTSRSSRRRTA